MRLFEPLNQAQLEHVCKVLADTSTGLTGSEIEHLLRQIKVDDTDPSMTKWKRLFNALANRQNTDHSADRVLSFIDVALQPAKHINDTSGYKKKLESINTVLAFLGLEYRDDGKFHTVDKASNLTEARSRASRLKQNIIERDLHPHLLNYCSEELLAENYFHAVLEACKGIASEVRKITGLSSDGARLIDEAFGGVEPRIRINPLTTETHKSEQSGFVNLAKGLMGTFRNPVAHEARIYWSIAAEDAIDFFTLASFILRRIDRRVIY
ncbi:MAG: TIGR02391 family protein [Calditrichaeota bacterium]|nr:TIGR02391 family protein [Calditrichota bacterium]